MEAYYGLASNRAFSSFQVSQFPVVESVSVDKANIVYGETAKVTITINTGAPADGFSIAMIRLNSDGFTRFDRPRPTVISEGERIMTIPIQPQRNVEEFHLFDVSRTNATDEFPKSFSISTEVTTVDLSLDQSSVQAGDVVTGLVTLSRPASVGGQR